jgi:LruC domain-containing protein
VYCTFTVRAQGAGLLNGFGFQLPSVDQSFVSAVTGLGDQSGYSIRANGTELGNAMATFILFNDSHKFMECWNTVKSEIPCPWKTFSVRIKFKYGSVTLTQLSIQDWNPFLVRAGSRGLEIHLPNYKPTDLADPSLFGTGNDDTKPSSGKYYKSSSNLPWAIDIYGTFDYPIETADISKAYLHFGNWAESKGASYPDWWSNKSQDYRESTLIY